MISLYTFQNKSPATSLSIFKDFSFFNFENYPAIFSIIFHLIFLFYNTAQSHDHRIFVIIKFKRYICLIMLRHSNEAYRTGKVGPSVFKTSTTRSNKLRLNTFWRKYNYCYYITFVKEG